MCDFREVPLKGRGRPAFFPLIFSEAQNAEKGVAGTGVATFGHKIEAMCWEWSNKLVEALGRNNCGVLFACTSVRKKTL